MKRKLEQGQHSSVKRNKIEIDVFHKTLFDETGSLNPNSQTLQKSPVKTLRKICEDFKISASKSGGVKRKVSIKEDYINAIIEYMNSLVLINDENVDVCMEQLEGENDQDPSNYVNASIQVRLFKHPQDYTTSYMEERILSYDPQVGISLEDLKNLFHQENLQVIHPKSYKPSFISDGILNKSLIPVMLGSQGYLRVSARETT